MKFTDEQAYTLQSSLDRLGKKLINSIKIYKEIYQIKLPILPSLKCRFTLRCY